MAHKFSGRVRQAPLKVGQQVVVRLGRQRIRGVLIENRGAIGIGGRRLWRVRAADVAGAEESITEFEVPAEQVTATSTSRAAPRPRTAGRAARSLAR